MTTDAKCPTCDGKGNLQSSQCVRCSGTGKLTTKPQGSAEAAQARNNSDTPTPLTDAVALHAEFQLPQELWVEADFARTLERALATAEKRVEELQADLDWMSAFFAFEDVDYDEMSGKSAYGWTVKYESLLEKLGGQLDCPETFPTLRAAIAATRQKEGQG